MNGTIPCESCGGEPVVAFERSGLFGHASGADAQCPDCKGARVAHCWWRLVCRGLPATRMADGRPACEGCAAEVVGSTDSCAYETPRFDGLSARLAKAHPDWSPARVQAEALKTLAAMEVRS